MTEKQIVTPAPGDESVDASRDTGRDYFTLLVRNEHGDWRIEFGDYEEETVQSELEDYLDHDVARRDLMIVCHPEGMQFIQAFVDKLNA